MRKKDDVGIVFFHFLARNSGLFLFYYFKWYICFEL